MSLLRNYQAASLRNGCISGTLHAWYTRHLMSHGIQVAVLLVQDEAENGDEIPEEDEVVVSKDSVIVTVPADFSLGESCQELMDQLAVVIYRYALGILLFSAGFC